MPPPSRQKLRDRPPVSTHMAWAGVALGALGGRRDPLRADRLGAQPVPLPSQTASGVRICHPPFSGAPCAPSSWFGFKAGSANMATWTRFIRDVWWPERSFPLPLSSHSEISRSVILSVGPCLSGRLARRVHFVDRIIE